MYFCVLQMERILCFFSCYINKSLDFISRFSSLVTCGNVKFVGMQRERLHGSRDPVHRVLTQL